MSGFETVLILGAIIVGGFLLLRSAFNDFQEKPCPKCGEKIKKVAVYCKHCKSDIPQNT